MDGIIKVKGVEDEKKYYRGPRRANDQIREKGFAGKMGKVVSEV